MLNYPNNISCNILLGIKVSALLSKVCGASLKHLTETYYNTDLLKRECASILRYESAPNKLGTLD